MDTEMGEAAEGTEVLPAQSDGCAKVNGDMNGAYTEKESPMDVSVEEDRPAKRIAAAPLEDVPDKQVPATNPELDEHISSNGFSHDAKENGDSMECDQETPSVVNSTSAKDNDISECVNQIDKPSDDANSESEPKSSESECTDNKKPEENGDAEDLPKSTNLDESKESDTKSETDKVDSDKSEEPPSDSTKTTGDDEQLKEDKKSEKEDGGEEKDGEGEEEKTEKKSESGEGEGDKNKSPEVIDIDVTPEKSKKPRKSVPINVTPRRSSRNLNKQKSYIEASENAQNSDDPDIEEIEPQDPLALDLGPESRKSAKKTTIVVSDTKRLAEIAAGSKPAKGGKKEPTLVIIDTNSILSGRGPVPVTAARGAPPQQAHQAPSFSVLPVTSLPPAASLYNAQAQTLRNQHTTIKPVVVGSSPSQTTLPQVMPNIPQAAPPPKPAPIVLPSLTDDMYVVEAPSFIVPYVYEKPPIKPLKEYIETLDKAIKMQKENEKKEKEEKEKREKEKKEQKEKELKEKEQKEKEEKEKAEKAKEEGKTEEEVEKMDVDNEEGKEAAEAKSEEKMDVDEESSEKKDEKEKEETTKDKEDDSSSSVEEVKVKPAEVEEKPKDLTKKDKEEKPTETKEESGSGEEKKKSGSYFENPLGKFFMQIGINLVQEHVQTDLLRSQKRKRDREGSKCAPDVQVAINSLLKTLEFSKENNEPFKMELKKCEFCSFKTESQLAMAHHLETPHMRNYVYRCNFCTLEVRSPHDILFHMEAEHNVRGRLERAPAFHQCPSCPFEDNQKGKLTRHLLSCAKKYRPERNQEPPLDWEPPAKIPRVPRNRPPAMTPGSAVYQAAMTGLKQGQSVGTVSTSPHQHPLLPKLTPGSLGANQAAAAAAMLAQAQNAMMGRAPGASSGRGRPNLSSRWTPDLSRTANQNMLVAAHHKAMAQQMRPGMVYRPSGSNAQPQVLLPTSYQIASNQIYQSSSSTSVSTSATGKPGQAAAAKLLQQQPSISITPLPRPHQASSSASAASASSSSASASSSAAAMAAAAASASAPTHGKPGRPLGSGKATFVICEICDGYIKDLELLRNHMQWIHKVKIHPKMIYNRPPLNCQKCQFRFFTDQGLERHLLGSHGLVTSSMQEAANKGKDGGRCPVCGRVYQWKLLNHVARDHNMSLKPAHLSYKCTVCTATFGMYKQFENHVYSAHSVVAKRVMDKKVPSSSSSSASQASAGNSSQSESLLKPLKINDEITIIPHPPRSKTKPGPAGRLNPSSSKGKI
ncbi:MOG interacting and ectopic P-granules protein 1 isoform X2 [Nilaparvata lugens]|uniref:MOG interacting and ectopic P-granules protein 1 isoform X2 n=1 Tax=Nilaparvata lugens TaxID=108931 RepID=UPI00193CD62E|nr:MOG interacting and ectopic P-granules protein 1 isoform X2 [Nilaparvata lugens]XP_039286245.1 MOG interacting and ectopic P-granules protein 1 isoform X2 [Nilaparvata lugens]